MSDVLFGFLPEAFDRQIGAITIETLPGLSELVAKAKACEGFERDWLHAPPAQSVDIMSGQIRTKPHRSRVFGLAKTHRLAHSSATSDEHLEFLVWALSFVKGLRLTTTDAGFLDAAPMRIGQLHDIVWLGKSEDTAIERAEEFWQCHSADVRLVKGVISIIHCLYVSQLPLSMDFERFIYLYTALDGCYAVMKKLNPSWLPKNKKGNDIDVKHTDRIGETCAFAGIPVPTWAQVGTSNIIAKYRNDTIHEGLFFDEPLGFRTFGAADPTLGGTLLEMECLVSRLLFPILGFNSPAYLNSPISSRSRHGVRLQ